MENLVNEDDLIYEWNKFLKAVEKSPTIRPVTIEAWKRCKDLGLDPNDLKFKFLSDDELKKKIAENSQLIEAAKPYLDHLSLSLTGITHLVTLTDSYGWVIDFRGTADEMGGEEIWDLSWSKLVGKGCR